MNDLSLVSSHFEWNIYHLLWIRILFSVIFIHEKQEVFWYKFSYSIQTTRVTTLFIHERNVLIGRWTNCNNTWSNIEARIQTYTTWNNITQTFPTESIPIPTNDSFS